MSAWDDATRALRAAATPADSAHVSPVHLKLQRVRAAAAAFLAAVWLLHAAYVRLVPQGALATTSARHMPPSLPLPWPLYAATQVGALALKAAARHATPAHRVVLGDLLGGLTTPLLHAACDLRLPDAVRLAGDWAPECAGSANCSSPSWLQGTSVAGAAAATGVSAAAARRLLRALGAAGYAARTTGDRWLARPPLAALRADAPGGSLCPFVSHHVTLAWAAWGQLPSALAAGGGGGGGGSPHERAHGGADFWRRLERAPQLNAAMTAAMAAIEPLAADALVADGGWGAYCALVDVGGSSGSFVASLLAAHPASLRCATVFDRPSTVADARAALTQRCARSSCSGGGGGGSGGGSVSGDSAAALCASLASGRLRFVGGSFFVAGSIPVPESVGPDAAGRCSRSGLEHGEAVGSRSLGGAGAGADAAGAGAVVGAGAGDDAANSSSHASAASRAAWRWAQQQPHNLQLASPPPWGPLQQQQQKQASASMPVGYILRVVLHDFSDAECALILRNLREAMVAGRDDGVVRAPSQLLLVEQLWEEAAPWWGVPLRGQADLHMLAVTSGGHERSLRQWTALLRRSGFELMHVRPTRSLFSVLVAEAKSEQLQ